QHDESVWLSSDRTQMRRNGETRYADFFFAAFNCRWAAAISQRPNSSRNDGALAPYQFPSQVKYHQRNRTGGDAGESIRQHRYERAGSTAERAHAAVDQVMPRRPAVHEDAAAD